MMRCVVGLFLLTEISVLQHQIAKSTTRNFVIYTSKRKGVSGDDRLEPVGQFPKFELARLLGAVERVAHHDLAQFSHRLAIAEPRVEQVDELLQPLIGIACRRGAKGFEEAMAP